MSNPNKPGGKSGQRSRKPAQQPNLKAVQPQDQKTVEQPSLKAMQPQDQKTVQAPSLKPVQPLDQKSPPQQPGLKPVQPLSQKPAQPPVQPQSQKPEQPPKQQPEQQQETRKQIAAAVASANTLSIDFQAIATAYSEYTKKSFEETKAFVEKLSGVRSVDKAIEIQTEFAKQAYETFVTESRKICELYSDLARQSLKPFEDLVANTTRAAR